MLYRLHIPQSSPSIAFTAITKTYRPLAPIRDPRFLHARQSRSPSKDRTYRVRTLLRQLSVSLDGIHGATYLFLMAPLRGRELLLLSRERHPLVGNLPKMRSVLHEVQRLASTGKDNAANESALCANSDEVACL